MLLLFHVFGGCTATILRGLTYPKILCTPIKEEGQNENGDIDPELRLSNRLPVNMLGKSASLQLQKSPENVYAASGPLDYKQEVL